MKRFTQFFVTALVISFLSVVSLFGQDNDDSIDIQDKKQQIILGIPKITNKTLPIVTGALEKISGAEYVMFCPKDKLLIIEYDLKIYPDEEDLIQAFHRQNVRMPMFIKEAVIEEIIEQCQQEKSY